jgi:hypothetical protein
MGMTYLQPPPETPAPPTGEQLAEVLLAAADGAILLADRPGRDIDSGHQRVDVLAPALGGLWRLLLWWDGRWWDPGDRLQRLSSAVAPGGGWWGYGCQRWPDWDAGPAAVILNPLQHLMSDGDRDRLRVRLLDCRCWPPLPQPRWNAPPIGEIWSEAELEVMGGG